MKAGKVELLIITDRSGSMATIKNDMELGLKTFLEKQKGEPGECRITHYEFDTAIDKTLEDVDIHKVYSIAINPRGATALFDAVGQAVNEVGARLAKTKEKDRPESVIVLVITDGEENASNEFSGEQIQKLIKHQEEKYSWKFIYLGANQDAFANGKKYGFAGGSSISYATTTRGIFNSMDILSSGISCLRSKEVSNQDFSFSDEQRKQAML